MPSTPSISGFRDAGFVAKIVLGLPNCLLRQVREGQGEAERRLQIVYVSAEMRTVPKPTLDDRYPKPAKLCRMSRNAPRGGRVMRSGSRFFAAVLLSAGRLAAQEAWSWHSVDFGLLKARGFEWALHTRLRTREGELQQGRSGTILRFTPRSRITVIGGYYYGREEDTREEWQNSHRVFAGAETRVYRQGTLSVASRALVERFATGDRPSFTRFRYRIRASTDLRIGPYTSGEWFWDAKGYLAGRYQGGVRWRGSKWASLEFGYIYDARSSQLGPSRHGAVTHLLLKP